MVTGPPPGDGDDRAARRAGGAHVGANTQPQRQLNNSVVTNNSLSAMHARRACSACDSSIQNENRKRTSACRRPGGSAWGLCTHSSHEGHRGCWHAVGGGQGASVRERVCMCVCQSLWRHRPWAPHASWTADTRRVLTCCAADTRPQSSVALGVMAALRCVGGSVCGGLSFFLCAVTCRLGAHTTACPHPHPGRVACASRRSRLDQARVPW